MKTISSSLLAAFVAVVATSCLESTQAFAPAFCTTSRSIAATPFPGPMITSLRAEAEEAAEETEAEEAVEELEEEEEPEDPEVVALKEEIADLERTLKDKKSQVNYLKDSTETYSKAGYARKVAEMENMRRARSSMASSNREVSVANVLRSFLPVKDQLDNLRQQYAQDDFGQNYVALAGNFNTALAEMGVTDYTATAGDPVDRTKVLVIEEEYSSEIPKGSVVRPLKMGLELKGNIIRLAECVGSLGDESEAEEEEAQEESSEEAAEE